MQNNIPIPTDNVFKFYAFFGLLLLIFSFASLIYVNTSLNTSSAALIIEIESLKAIEKPTAVELAKRRVAERQLTVNKSNKDFYINCLGGVAALGVCLMYYGFSRWHREIQPVQDETARLQLEKLRIEVAALKLQNTPGPSKTAPQPKNNEAAELNS